MQSTVKRIKETMPRISRLIAGKVNYKCSKCGKWYPLSKYFDNKLACSGKQYECKVCYSNRKTKLSPPEREYFQHLPATNTYPRCRFCNSALLPLISKNYRVICCRCERKLKITDRQYKQVISNYKSFRQICLLRAGSARNT